MDIFEQPVYLLEGGDTFNTLPRTEKFRVLGIKEGSNELGKTIFFIDPVFISVSKRIFQLLTRPDFILLQHKISAYIKR